MYAANFMVHPICSTCSLDEKKASSLKFSLLGWHHGVDAHLFSCTSQRAGALAAKAQVAILFLLDTVHKSDIAWSTHAMRAIDSHA